MILRGLEGGSLRPLSRGNRHLQVYGLGLGGPRQRASAARNAKYGGSPRILPEVRRHFDVPCQEESTCVVGTSEMVLRRILGQSS